MRKKNRNKNKNMEKTTVKSGKLAAKCWHVFLQPKNIVFLKMLCLLAGIFRENNSMRNHANKNIK